MAWPSHRRGGQRDAHRLVKAVERVAVKEYDKRTKVLTVTFENEIMTVTDPDQNPTDVLVSFVLTRAPTG